MVLPPKDFIKINKYLLKKNTDINGEKIPEKEMRKKLRNIRIKIKKGKKQSRNIIKSSSCVYGLANPKHEDIADIINNTYGNNAEKKLKEIYESFIKEKSKIRRITKVIPRYISTKVEEMKKKEEEKKENKLIASTIGLKPLYKLKRFLNVGSKVTEAIKKFKTFKPILSKNKSMIINENNINKVINDIEKDVKEKEKNELIKNDLINSNNI